MYKKIFIALIAVFIFSQYLGNSYGASSDSDSGYEADLYGEAKKFILRAKKLEKKNNCRFY